MVTHLPYWDTRICLKTGGDLYSLRTSESDFLFCIEDNGPKVRYPLAVLSPEPVTDPLNRLDRVRRNRYVTHGR